LAKTVANQLRLSPVNYPICAMSSHSPYIYIFFFFQ